MKWIWLVVEKVISKNSTTRGGILGECRGGQGQGRLPRGEGHALIGGADIGGHGACGERQGILDRYPKGPIARLDLRRGEGRNTSDPRTCRISDGVIRLDRLDCHIWIDGVQVQVLHADEEGPEDRRGRGRGN